MRRSLSVPVILSILVLASLTHVAGAAPPFRHLDPGGPASLHETVPVTFVFVGYEPGIVNPTDFQAGLPERYRPVVRSRLWYGVTEHLGLRYDFDYRLVYADAAYEDALFSALDELAVPESSVDGQIRTLFQDLYNDQEGNVLDVTENHFIDGPSVERWLAENPPPGVDTSRNTVFFVNWWGRPDFKFHTYTKFGEPDPDTGFDFGFNAQSRKLIAWGGTPADDEETGLGSTHRLWFYDLSAGPESWTDNWNVDQPDLDGNGVEDYRMPPVWEYLTAGGYRPAAALSGDLAKVARFVAINLLFTTSPLYPPYLTPERLPASINLDANTYEALPGVDASETYQDPPFTVQEESELNPRVQTFDDQDLDLTGTARRCYLLWLRQQACDRSRPQYPPFANLFLYHALNIDQFRDGGGEYETLMFNYATNDRQAPPLLGFADDNYVDGTQSFVFNFVSPFISEIGYGLSTTQIHEVGHHVGMSHPHDGFDSELGLDYGPGDEYYFAWSGDENNTIMSYIDVNWDFSQFDRDNANRFYAAAYIVNANAIAADILASQNAGVAMDDLRRADAEIGVAEAALRVHDYPGAHQHAVLAYEHVRAGADQSGVEVEASQNGWTVLPPVSDDAERRAKGYSYRDRLGPRHHRARP